MLFKIIQWMQQWILSHIFPKVIKEPVLQTLNWQYISEEALLHYYINLVEACSMVVCTYLEIAYLHNLRR